MKRIGVTGSNGFIGIHLLNSLKQCQDEFCIVPFDRSFFDDQELLVGFVRDCDVIVHLAGINRHESEEILLNANLGFANSLVNALVEAKSSPHIIISSSVQEELGNTYGNAKKLSREILRDWAARADAPFTGALIPNVFGPFGKPYYNSFIATFCDQITNNNIPEIIVDTEVHLIYVQDLVDILLREIRTPAFKPILEIPSSKTIKVSDVCSQLLYFKNEYFDSGNIPSLTTSFDLNLFNTLRSFIDLKAFFPRRYKLHTDARGSFVELVQLGVGGQVSFSTTVPGITRGNHYHTRKVERFSVIRGKARIQMRRIDSDSIFSFDLNGEEPSFVDMPIWYTHNIKNIGNDILYTVFWINEIYNPEDSDTYFMEV